MDLSDLRRDFGKSGLNEARLPVDPVDILKQWLQEALDANIPEFNAMVLSTVDVTGKPSSRIVLLKELDDTGRLVFYTNYLSRKGKELMGNPNAAVNIFWREMERQVRIEGKVSKTSREVSEAYFKSRPLESQLSAIVSPQSQEITDLSALKQKADELFVSGKQIRLPEYWGGFALQPDVIEFWQGGKNRLHDRIQFSRMKDHWTRVRLAP